VTKDFYLTKRGDVWQVRFRIEGTILPAKTSGQTNKTRAEAWARKEWARLQEEMKKVSTAPTLAEWVKPFFTETCPHITRLRLEGKRYADNTAKMNRYFIKHIESDEPLSAMKVDEIRRRDILAFRERLVAKKGRSRTSQQVMKALRVIMKEALFRELTEIDAFAGVSQLAYEGKERGVLAPEALKKLLVRSAFDDELFYLATMTAALTGMRAGEVRALQWQDILKDRIIVQRSFPGNSTVATLPKWGKIRTVPYPSRLSELLEPRRGGVDEWVFLRDDGPIGYIRWGKAFREACKRKEITGISLHSLRHSLNTILRGEGISDEKLRGSFGWGDSQIQDRYTHRENYDYSDQATAIDRMLGGTHE
jgi:integrase